MSLRLGRLQSENLSQKKIKVGRKGKKEVIVKICLAREI